MHTKQAKNKSRNLTVFLLLALPICIYVLTFLAPITGVIALSIDNRDVSNRFNNFKQYVTQADTEDKDKKVQALLLDLEQLSTRQGGQVARILNQEKIGFRSLLLKTRRGVDKIERNYEGLIQFDKKWAEQEYWDILEKNINPITMRYFDTVLGRTASAGKNISKEEDNIYLTIIKRTLVISVQVTLLTLLIGYPLAYGVATGGKKIGSFILMVVLLSFWTSILVRTTAWLVLLQTNGVVNNFLINLGLINEPLQLIFNRFGTLMAVTHVLLPFAIIPMINVMKTIPKAQGDASRSLGAGRIETFLRVYFPQSLRGVFVGGGIVFILSLGFYITPALTGGPSDQMVAFYIADFVTRNLNWGMAAALSVVLLASILLLLSVFGVYRLLNVKKWRLA